MGWLGLKKRPGRGKKSEELQQEEEQPLQPLTPVLNLLVPDIAGVTSFRLRQFFDIGEARAFVQSLPTISGLHAFWGLHAPPLGHDESEETGEAMVLIRSAEGSDTVYVVSFVDLESALSFARFEVKRGMGLPLLLIYWAEIAEVDADEYGVRFTPDAPPLPGFAARRFGEGSWAEVEAPAAEAIVELPEATTVPVAVSESPDVVMAEETVAAVIEVAKAEEPAPPEPEMAWTGEVTEAFEKETEEQFGQFVAEQEELRAAAEPEPVAEPITELEPPEVQEADAAAEVVISEPVAAEEPEAELVSMQAEETTAEPFVSEPVAVEEPGPTAAPEAEAPPGAGLSETPREPTQEEMDIEREAIAFVKASANGKKMGAKVGPEGSLEEVAAEAPAIEEASAEPEPASTEMVHEEYEHAPEPNDGLVEEVEKILKVKRWDKRESPFRGFDSPPGRF